MSHVSRLNTSCDAYEWVMPNLNESCHTNERFMSHTSRAAELTQVPVVESCHTYEDSCHTYDWVMSHIWMSHVTRVNGACHTHLELRTSWISHVTNMTESCHTYEWVTLHVWMSHVTHIQSCRTHASPSRWVLSYIWRIHVTHMNESGHTYAWVMSHVWMSHVTHIQSCRTYASPSRLRKRRRLVSLGDS